MKVIVNRTGKFMLMEPETRTVIDKPTLVTETEFVRARIFTRELEALSIFRFPDEAKNEDFQGFVKEAGGDLALAVASFQSLFETPAPAPVNEDVAKVVGDFFDSKPAPAVTAKPSNSKKNR
jgi:hypothetical protein